VELPPVADKTYPVLRRTEIERIIFLGSYDDQDVIALAGQKLSDEKTAWRGYGTYQP
jgi:hypothetical protein